MDNEEVEAFVDKIIKGTTQYLQTMFMKKFYKNPPDTMSLFYLCLRLRQIWTDDTLWNQKSRCNCLFLQPSCRNRL